MERGNSAALNQSKALLLEAAQAGGVAGLLTAAAKVFASPVLLLDEYFRVLGSAPAQLPSGGVWQQVAAGVLPEELMWPLLRKNLPESGHSYTPLYVSEGIFAGEPLLLGEWQHDGEIRGHIIVAVGSQTRQSDDLQLLSTLIYLIDLHLAQDSERIAQLAQWHRTAARQLQLLLSENSPANQREIAATAIKAKLPGRYTILVTHIGERAAQQAFGEYAVSHLQQLYSGILSVRFEESIVTLIGGIRFRPTDPIVRPGNNELVEKLFRYFEQYNLQSGLSSSFQDLCQLRGYYRQALFTSRLADKIAFKTPAVFLELMPLPLFAAALEADPEQIFLHPVLPQIRAYDRAHNTDYEQTLRTYELCMCDREMAAEQLNVHRNTLKYRLERIEELFYLPLDDNWTNLNLLCASLLLELQPELADRDPAAAAPKNLMACAAPLLQQSFFTGEKT